jgi:hypothetical protein
VTARTAAQAAYDARHRSVLATRQRLERAEVGAGDRWISSILPALDAILDAASVPKTPLGGTNGEGPAVGGPRAPVHARAREGGLLSRLAGGVGSR